MGIFVTILLLVNAVNIFGPPFGDSKVSLAISALVMYFVYERKQRKEISKCQILKIWIVSHVGMAQISPVWLNRERTLDKIIEYVPLGCKRGVPTGCLRRGPITGLSILDWTYGRGTVQFFLPERNSCALYAARCSN